MLLGTPGCPSGDDDDSAGTPGDDDTGDDDTAGDDDSASGTGDDGFGEFALWSEPLTDYIEALTAEYGATGFYRSVWDLSVYLDRLYLGYGDADINSGRIFPTELRYFDDPGAPDDWTSDFAVDEEMVDQYRQFDGDDGLFISGLDATEDDLWGNAYNRHPDTGWVKSRTLEHALHVHDIALFGGDLYAVGSGCTWEEYDAFQISSMLWHSTDGGENYEVWEKLQHPDTGDARWVRLLPLGSEMYLFGYRTDTQYITEFIPYRFDGATLEPFDSMNRLWVFETYVVADGLGLVTGLNIPSFGDYTYEAYLLEEGGAVTEIGGMGDVTVVDAFGQEDGSWLVLARDGNLYGDPPGELHRVLLTHDFSSFEEIASYTGDSFASALASWQGSLYLGLEDGTIWRAEPR